MPWRQDLLLVYLTSTLAETQSPFILRSQYLGCSRHAMITLRPMGSNANVLYCLFLDCFTFSTARFNSQKYHPYITPTEGFLWIITLYYYLRKQYWIITTGPGSSSHSTISLLRNVNLNTRRTAIFHEFISALLNYGIRSRKIFEIIVAHSILEEIIQH